MIFINIIVIQLSYFNSIPILLESVNDITKYARAKENSCNVSNHEQLKAVLLFQASYRMTNITSLLSATFCVIGLTGCLHREMFCLLSCFVQMTSSSF